MVHGCIIIQNSRSFHVRFYLILYTLKAIASKRQEPLLKHWLKKNELYLSVNVFSTKVIIGHYFFYVSYWRGERQFTWSSESREGLAACNAEGVLVPSFLSYFKTLSVGPVPEIEPAISRPGSQALYRLS